MAKYLVVNIDTRESTLTSLKKAARITELDPDEIEWAIEEVGRCDAEDWTVLHGSLPTARKPDLCV